MFLRGVQLVLVAACLAGVLGAGCGREGGKPPAAASDGECVAAGENLLAVTAGNLLGLEGRQKEIMQTQLERLRSRFVAACTRQGWPARIRACLIAAADVPTFDACTAPLLPATPAARP